MNRSRLTVLLIGLLLVGMLAACAPPAAAPSGETGDAGESAAAGDLIPVTYTYASRGIPQDLQMVQDAMNEILNEKIGVELTLEPIDFAALQRQDAVASGRGRSVRHHLHRAVDQQLRQQRGQRRAHAAGRPAAGVCARPVGQHARNDLERRPRQGHIYGVINQQIFPKPWGVHPRVDLLEKYDFSLDDVTKYEDMEPWLEAVRDGEGITPVYGHDGDVGASLWRAQYWGYDPLDDGIAFMGMKADDDSLTPVNYLETEEFKAAADLTKQVVRRRLLPQGTGPSR